MKNNDTTQHFILSRTDNIGDVVLSLPVAHLLKKAYPGCKISLLSKQYTASIAKHCPDIDTHIDWTHLATLDATQQVKILKNLQCDCIIHIFPNPTVAKLAKAAKIKQRIGSSRRWYHWLTCTNKIKFSRSKSNLHEAQLNLKLLGPLKIDSDISIPELSPMIKLQQPMLTDSNTTLKHLIEPNRFNLVLHPLSNKSAREWPTQNFIQLCQYLPKDRFNIIFTGSKNESDFIKSKIMPHCPNAIDASGKVTLDELISLLHSADGIVVGSTGPLHIAAACGTRALGLFPPQHNIHPRRWGPIGTHAQFLISQPDCQQQCSNSNCLCMQNITVNQVKKIVMQWSKQKEAICPA